MASYLITNREHGLVQYLIEADSAELAREAFLEGSADTIQLDGMDVTEGEIVEVALYDGPALQIGPDPEAMQAAVAEVVRKIEIFDRNCEAAEHTDTDKVWALLAEFRDKLRPYLSAAQIAGLEETRVKHEAELEQVRIDNGAPETPVSNLFALAGGATG